MIVFWYSQVKGFILKRTGIVDGLSRSDEFPRNRVLIIIYLVVLNNTIKVQSSVDTCKSLVPKQQTSHTKLMKMKVPFLTSIRRYFIGCC